MSENTPFELDREAVRRLEKKVEELEGENNKLRELLWLRHGCPMEGLYGDDGEMQCNSPCCMLDFKRMSPYKIEKEFVIKSGAMTREQFDALEKFNEQDKQK